MISSRSVYLLLALLLVVACIGRTPATKTARNARPDVRPSPTAVAELEDEGTTEDEGTSEYEDEGTTEDDDDEAVEDSDDGEPGEKAAAPEHPEPPTVLAGNIVFQTLRAGDGRRPMANEYVRVRYVGRLADGTVFDDSSKHGGDLGFYLSQVIRCWTTGVTHMNVGAKARLTCPPETAYGPRGAPPTIPPNATLEFDIELLAIQPRR